MNVDKLKIFATIDGRLQKRSFRRSEEDGVVEWEEEKTSPTSNGQVPFSYREEAAELMWIALEAILQQLKREKAKNEDQI